MGQRIPPPNDYSECYERYIVFIRQTVSRHGIDDQDVQDVADDIFMRIIAKDLLGQYDPNRLFSTPRGPKYATFTAMLSTFVNLCCRDYKDKQHDRWRREPVSIDTQVGADSDAAVWLELNSPKTHADGDLVHARVDFVRAAKNALATLEALPIRNPRDRRKKLPALFRYCLERTLLDGTFTRKEVAEHFNISDTATYQLFLDLKEELKTAGFDHALKLA